MRRRIDAMKKIIILTALACITVACHTQEKSCNRTVHVTSFAKRLPSDICLPEGYILWDILADTVDINGDGRIDFAARLQKIDAQDGDTTLVVLYKQSEKGNYKEWVTFDNLFPIYMDDYRYDYDRNKGDTTWLMKLRVQYQSPEFSSVLFEKDTIIVKFNTSAGSGLLMYFKLNEKQNDWNLVKQATWDGDVRTNEIKEIPDYGIVIPKDKYSIRKFNMLDYLDDVIW